MSQAQQTPAIGADPERTARAPAAFFLLVFVLSIPFWAMASATGRRLLPGLPVSALGVVCPTLAASILVYRERKTAGVVALLRRAFDHRRIRAKRWYVPAVLLVPTVSVVAYALMRGAGRPLPAPSFPPVPSLALGLAFFVGALGEELGWSGYALDPLEERWGALGAAILLGLVTAAWHIVPLLQVDRAPAWIAWWCVYTVAGRVLTTWIYDNAGRSVLAAALYHASSNLSWQLFPRHGSHWDPRVVGGLLALAAAAVAILWGPRTLTGYERR